MVLLSLHVACACTACHHHTKPPHSLFPPGLQHFQRRLLPLEGHVARHCRLVLHGDRATGAPAAHTGEAAMSVTWAGMRVGGLGGMVLWGKVGWYAGMGRGGWTPNLHGTCWQEGRAIYVALSPGVQIMADKGEVWQRLVDKHGLQVGSLCPRTAWDSVGGHERAWPGLGQHGTAWAGIRDSMRGHGAALDSMGQHERAWGSMRQHGTV